MARPEPMNAMPAHAKAKVTLLFSDRIYVAGEDVTGKVELECKAERGLGIADIKVELFAIQELTLREHSATNTFLHLTRYFQGEGLPPSNAVHAVPLPECNDSLPEGYYEARKGRTIFFFRFPLPPSTPASVDFDRGLAKLKYEVRASVGISWRSELQRVMERKEVSVVEMPASNADAEQVVVAENGKLWAQGRVLGEHVVAGRTSCLELFVKNHTGRPTSSLSLSLTRHLQIPNLSHPHKSLQLSETFLDMPFEGAEYIVQPGTEGVANLVFHVPPRALGVRAGKLDSGEEASFSEVDSIFGLQLILAARVGTGSEGKDIILNIPVSVAHPTSLRALPASPGYAPALSPVASPSYPISPHHMLSQYPYAVTSPVMDYFPGYASPPLSPPPSQSMWSPSPIQQYIYIPPPLNLYQIRPASADPFVGQHMPIVPMPPLLNPHEEIPSPQTPVNAAERTKAEDGEPGKGDRASRISAHLRMSSRNRSVSPQSRRFPQPALAPDIETSPITPRTFPAPQPTHGSPLTVVTTHASPKSDARLHSPRPVLSPKHSFSADNGTVKSEQVADLERMAAEELLEMDSQKPLAPDVLNKTLPSPPPPSKRREPPIVQLEIPSEPVLYPLLNHRRLKPDSWERGSGLEALERKLSEQVGTRKPDATPRADVRDVVKPINIPANSSLHANPLNDSAISSLSLGQAFPEHTGSSSVEQDVRSPALGVHAPVDDEELNNVHTKRVDKSHLKKAATGRVALWLGGLEPASDEPPVDSPPSNDVPTSDTDEPQESADIDPHPLLWTPVDTLTTMAEISPSGEAIPERSSGFVLQSVDDSSAPPMVQTTYNGHAGILYNDATSSSPKPDSMATSPIKPVLRRFALATKRDLSEAKYDIRSARGGRGGKVASVGAIWASMAAQEEAKTSAPLESGRGEFNPVFRQPRPKMASNAAKSMPSPPTATTQRKPLDTAVTNVGVGNLSTRRARMIKSPSVPAILSSSFATPVLSSTASLARPIIADGVPNRDLSHDQLATCSLEHTDGYVAQTFVKPLAIRSPPPDPGFGQTRLKDLIRKYQQGLG